MNLDELTAFMLPELENELHSVLELYRQASPANPAQDPSLPELSEILSYHMGWSGHNPGQSVRGKRIRPLLTLLVCQACGGNWRAALPPASAVELVHNFSLIHDDIQDESSLRHGQETIWRRWGAAQAINAGDLMFTLAMVAIVRIDRNVNLDVAIRAENILLNACMHLTRGQTLDLAYESCDFLTPEDYWPMVSGKTAALLSACAKLGGLFAGTSNQTMDHLVEFGRKLGLAFQVQDDLLGIWGDTVLTGKSIESDLVSRKKTLPVLFGLGLNGPFAKRWKNGHIQEADVSALAEMLAQEGARDFAEQEYARLTSEAMDALAYAVPHQEDRLPIEELTGRLLSRRL